VDWRSWRSETSISWRKIIAGVAGGEDGDGKRRPLRCDRADNRRAELSGIIKSIFQDMRVMLWSLVDGGREGVKVSLEGSQVLRPGEYVK
jgi:hypothetical protein